MQLEFERDRPQPHTRRFFQRHVDRRPSHEPMRWRLQPNFDPIAFRLGPHLRPRRTASGAKRQPSQRQTAATAPKWLSDEAGPHTMHPRAGNAHSLKDERRFADGYHARLCRDGAHYMIQGRSGQASRPHPLLNVRNASQGQTCGRRGPRVYCMGQRTSPWQRPAHGVSRVACFQASLIRV